MDGQGAFWSGYHNPGILTHMERLKLHSVEEAETGVNKSSHIMINFLIAGAQKCGTTSLHYCLARHPQIIMPECKETQFFSRQYYFEKGARWLKSFYSKPVGGRLVGCSDVDILWRPQALKNIFAFNSEMKIIIVLRNPVQRAYSAYSFERQKCLEQALTFEEAIQREMKTSDEITDFGYLSRGLYARQLQEVYSYFPSSQVHVIFFEDLRNNLEKVLEGVHQFLGVEVRPVGPVRKENVTGAPRFVFFQKMLFVEDIWYKRTWSRLAPLKLRLTLRKRLLKPLHRLNYKQHSYSQMSSETSAMLKDYFRQDVLQLQKITGKDLGSWLV